jgi:hypothetical protein
VGAQRADDSEGRVPAGRVSGRGGSPGALRYRFPSLAETLRNLKESQPPLTKLLDQLGDADRVTAWAEIERSLRPLLRETGSRGQPRPSSPPEWPQESLSACHRLDPNVCLTLADSAESTDHVIGLCSARPGVTP